MQDLLQRARKANLDAPWACGRELLLLAIVAYALARSSEALAAEPRPLDQEFGPVEGAHPLPSGAAAQFALPENFVLPAAPHEFSATEFSPRKNAAFGAAAANLHPAPGPRSLSTTTVWQRLADYRSHDRVRLVTLWETTGSTLSIQAGKRGEPSLQWTSRAMNRGGATRGLLDRMISASLGAAGVGQLRNITRPALPAAVSPTKPAPTLLPSLAKAP